MILHSLASSSLWIISHEQLVPRAWGHQAIFKGTHVSKEITMGAEPRHGFLPFCVSLGFQKYAPNLSSRRIFPKASAGTCGILCTLHITSLGSPVCLLGALSFLLFIAVVVFYFIPLTACPYAGCFISDSILGYHVEGFG